MVSVAVIGTWSDLLRSVKKTDPTMRLQVGIGKVIPEMAYHSD